MPQHCHNYIHSHIRRQHEKPLLAFVLGLFQKLSSGVGGPQALFVLCVGGSVLLTTCPRGGGGVNLSWGSRRI